MIGELLRRIVSKGTNDVAKPAGQPVVVAETRMMQGRPRVRTEVDTDADNEEMEEPELGPEYTVDGQRAKDFLGSAETVEREVLDAWGGTIRHYPQEMNRGDYTLAFGNVVGSGSYGTVMEATRKPNSSAMEAVREASSTPEDIVVKFIILNPESDKYEKRLTAVYRELAALSQNRMLYDAYQLQTEQTIDDTVVVVIEMKKLEGPDLSNYIETLAEKSDRYSSEQRLEIMKIIRSCLVQMRVLAKRGWQHRDIKPANILTNRGHARIADFGIARRVDDTTGTQHSTGTPLYMTPRTVESKRDALADLYALGVIAGEAMGYIEHGRHENAVQILMAISRGELWKKSTVSEAITPHTNAEASLMELIEDIIQLGAGKDTYRNPFGSDDFTKENIVETTTTLLRRVHDIIKQQETELAQLGQRENAA